MYEEGDGFDSYFGYTGGRLGDVGNQGVEARDLIEVKGVEYQVTYLNYPRKKLEELIIFSTEGNADTEEGIAQLAAHCSGHDRITITRENNQSYKFSAGGKIASWEEANPALKYSDHRIDTIKRIFDLFYQKLAEKYDIQGHVDKFEEMAKLQVVKAEQAETGNEELSKQFKEARKKYIDTFKGKPDPLEEMFL